MIVVGEKGKEFGGREYTIRSDGHCICCGLQTFYMEYSDGTIAAEPCDPFHLQAEAEINAEELGFSVPEGRDKPVACYGCFCNDADKHRQVLRLLEKRGWKRTPTDKTKEAVSPQALGQLRAAMRSVLDALRGMS